MSLGSIAYTQTDIGAEVQILFNSAYVGRALTLDTTAFTSGLCKAGTPITAAGKKATTTAAAASNPASSDAIGILLHDVSENYPQATVVIGGYIRKSVAQEHSGVTYDAPTMEACKNIVFM